MAKKIKDTNLQNLPGCAAEFIKLVVKKMRYRKKVRTDVQAELAAHFEDELKDCKTDTEKEQKAQQLITEFGDVKLLAVLMRRAKKRCRPLWRTVVARTFQTAGVLILCFIVYCIYISLGKPTININYAEEAMRITRPEADESQNAAPLYQQAFNAFKEPPLVEDETGTEKTSLLNSIRDKGWVADLTKEELTLLKQWLGDNADAINFFKEASQKPHCWWHREAEDNMVLDTLLPELKNMRGFAKLLCWRAKLQTFNGNIEQAFDDLLVCYRAGRHFKGPRYLVEQLVGMAIQSLSARAAIIILQNQQVNEELLRSFQADIEKLTAEDIFTVDLRTEKFFALDFLQRCYTDNGSGSGHMIPGQVQEFIPIEPGKLLAISVISANRREMSQEFEKVYDTVQEWAHKTPWQLRKENIDMKMGIDKWSRLKQIRYLPLMILLPAFGRVSEIGHRLKVDLEAMITIVALLRYQHDNDQYPQNLGELVANNYLKQLPMDPYSNKPLVYKKEDNNFTLYSGGPNFTDDGGTVAVVDGRPKKWGTKDEGDWVFWPVPKSGVNR